MLRLINNRRFTNRWVARNSVANLHGFGLGELERGDPRLPFDLGRGLDVEGLGAAVGDDERAAVDGVYEGAVQRDVAPAGVRHLGLVPANRRVS